jgi:hypothetical protein
MDNQVEQKFLKQFVADKKLQDDLAKCKTPDEAHGVVKKYGYDVDLDDFIKSMTKLNVILNPQKGQLSENDLDLVAGGRASIGHILASIGGSAAITGAVVYGGAVAGAAGVLSVTGGAVAGVAAAAAAA